MHITQPSASTHDSAIAARVTAPAKPDTSHDRIICAAELRDTLQRSQDTVKRWIRAGKLPPPDVQMSHYTFGWRRSTLLAAGIHLP